MFQFVSKTITMNSLTLTINDLFLNHRQSLIQTIYRIVGCPQTAEDLAHEAYLKMLHTSKIQEISYPHPFLYQIARNLALDHLRKEKIRQRSDNHPKDDEGSDNLLECIPSTSPTPEQQTANQQQVALMIEALNGLSERRRQILVLNKFHHWTYERIAQHYGISRSAVEKNVHVALAHLLSAQDESPF
ncbi:MAG: sigma-70 family RNA polymerase sigma factor [Methylobacter sp.]|nr:sigma-70 family RNA polymerase sigma factor [Methylobacter sp.]